MTSRERKDNQDSVEDMAAYWVVQLSAPEASPEDRYAFEAWKAQSPYHAEVFERIQRGNAVGDRLLGDPRMQALIDQAHADNKAPGWRRPGALMSAVAACVCVVAAVAVTTVLMSQNEPVSQAPVHVAAETYETAVGERSTVTLSDGSEVVLNTDSAMEVRFTDARREIELSRGQGYFEVAKDADRPFIVTAGDKQVMALGTVFDVHYEPARRIAVTLVEGLVDVDDAPSAAGGGANAKPASGVRLHPGERLVVSGREQQVETVDVTEMTSWRSGKIIFRDRLLSEVIAEMNRYSKQKLALGDDPRLADLRVSGAFNLGRASTFLNALEYMAPVEVQRTGATELTLVWRE
ncbi:FecR family protein [Henriciella aquimarina]|uniref:FecR family protein n=1 Tax=Henriciella aquimarina TaxID=545261 RepID=UPI0009FC9010|nr:FecR domain-containing protein [Henriciella aquimarina]